ncbi:MAG: hypothetical protein V4487_01300 [Chlamydiota bacterium]
MELHLANQASGLAFSVRPDFFTASKDKVAHGFEGVEELEELDDELKGNEEVIE